MTTKEHKDTIDKLRVDLRDVFGFLDEIDQNIRLLAESAKMQKVEIPALLATRNVLKRVDEDLLRLKREL
jgi:hypothetical protein